MSACNSLGVVYELVVWIRGFVCMDSVVIAQILAVIGYLVMILSFWRKDYRKIMALQVVGLVFFTAQFVVLGAYSGAVINAVNIAKTICFANRKSDSRTLVWVFGLLIVAGAIFTWQDLFSLFSLLAGVTYLVASYNRDPQVVRKGAILSSLCWVLYDVHTLAYSSAVFETVTVISNGIAVIKNRVVSGSKSA